jgi:hypothetical protein
MSPALPILIGMMPPDQMMKIFVVGGTNLPVATQIQFASAIPRVFRLSALLTARQSSSQRCGELCDADRSRAQDKWRAEYGI